MGREGGPTRRPCPSPTFVRGFSRFTKSSHHRTIPLLAVKRTVHRLPECLVWGPGKETTDVSLDESLLSPRFPLCRCRPSTDQRGVGVGSWGWREFSVPGPFPFPRSDIQEEEEGGSGLEIGGGTVVGWVVVSRKHREPRRRGKGGRYVGSKGRARRVGLPTPCRPNLSEPLSGTGTPPFQTNNQGGTGHPRLVVTPNPPLLSPTIWGPRGRGLEEDVLRESRRRVFGRTPVFRDLLHPSPGLRRSVSSPRGVCPDPVWTLQLRTA